MSKLVIPINNTMTSAPPFTRKKLQCKSVLKAYPSPCSGTKKLNLRLIHLNAGEGKKKKKEHGQFISICFSNSLLQPV